MSNYKHTWPFKFAIKRNFKVIPNDKITKRPVYIKFNQIFFPWSTKDKRNTTHSGFCLNKRNLYRTANTLEHLNLLKKNEVTPNDKITKNFSISNHNIPDGIY